MAASFHDQTDVCKQTFLIIALTLCIVRCQIVRHDVTTKVGTISGLLTNVTFDGNEFPLRTYLGIPYAEPPEKELRFRKPVPKAAFSSPYDATRKRDMCPQEQMHRYLPTMAFGVSEDCLVLNIYAPGADVNPTDSKAVMVWIHGGFDAGTFRTGAANFYIGDVLSVYGDVVVVTVNYRLAMMGFFTTHDNAVEGNFGLWDQHLAIQWVHKHIKPFGGDPSRVTLFGQGTGSVCALYQAMYPGNKGLVHRVIAESGTPLSVGRGGRNPYLSLAPWLQIATRLGCTGDVECLRRISMKKKISIMSSAHSRNDLANNREWYFTPVYDGEFLQSDPFSMLNASNSEFSDVRDVFSSLDLLIGVNDMDGWGKFDTVLQDLKTKHDSFDLSVLTSRLKETVTTSLGQLYQNEGNITMDNEALVDFVINRYTDTLAPESNTSAIRLYLQFLTDFEFRIPSLTTALAHARLTEMTDRRTFLYEFNFPPTVWKTGKDRPSWLTGAVGMDEVFFVFGFSGAMLKVHNVSSTFVPTPRELELSKTMMAFWSNFARHGNPDSQSNVWPTFAKKTSGYMKFQNRKDVIKTAYNFSEPSTAFWTKFVPMMFDVNFQTTRPELPSYLPPNTSPLFKMAAGFLETVVLVMLVAVAVCLIATIAVFVLCSPCRKRQHYGVSKQEYNMVNS